MRIAIVDDNPAMRQELHEYCERVTAIASTVEEEYQRNNDFH